MHLRVVMVPIPAGRLQVARLQVAGCRLVVIEIQSSESGSLHQNLLLVGQQGLTLGGRNGSYR